MIELRWRRAEFHPNSLEAEPNAVMMKDFPVVLQYREVEKSIFEGEHFIYSEWKDVELED